jgi:tetraacyldisaccharide 4'-kinase
VIAFAGIGRPAKFFDTLHSIGASVVDTVSFPDHHRFAEHELAALRRKAIHGAAVLVTTAKDWVRLPVEQRGDVEILTVGLRWHDEATLDTLLRPMLVSAATDGCSPRAAFA